MDEGENKGEEDELMRGKKKKGGFIRKGGHQSQGDLVNGKGSSCGRRRRYGREM